MINQPPIGQEAIIAANLTRVRARIAEAAQRAGRNPETITLVAVSKTKPLEVIKVAYNLGIRDFGENRVQEALEKQAAFSPSDLRWHMIGHLQTNKAQKVCGSFAYIHSVDSLHVALALQRAAEKKLHVDETEVQQTVLLQVNISGETTKEGMTIEDAPAIARQLLPLSHLKVQGLMTVAPLVDDPEQVRSVFRALRQLRDKLRQEVPEHSWEQLSMGMTDDYHIAIEEGATIVRVGRAIFGERVK
ncbi:YggS family pyridoxal phosphate enzyme [Dictyobacter vulcani]|uniref:Pyridoxal phosphate homeostasis protein n=1 Tax=Dictyobacter vulcani TaxID=2607529 RepID=A0A5J4KFR2_9CHLR|nr:YggS family pyridoxal phosphate-dependent enzyme [Dictyobacter vulcani]GER88328.1 YggS family pyridoxal phosphate enzyme [Dictyobacter vulcani]